MASEANPGVVAERLEKYPLRHSTKKPVTVAHMHLSDDSDECSNTILKWIADNGGIAMRIRPDGIRIETLEGSVRASVGDQIIRGVKGEFYPCKPDIFAETYADSATQSAENERLRKALYAVPDMNAIRRLANVGESLLHKPLITHALKPIEKCFGIPERGEPNCVCADCMAVRESMSVCREIVTKLTALHNAKQALAEGASNGSV